LAAYKKTKYCKISLRDWGLKIGPQCETWCDDYNWWRRNEQIVVQSAESGKDDGAAKGVKMTG